MKKKKQKNLIDISMIIRIQLNNKIFIIINKIIKKILNNKNNQHTFIKYIVSYYG